MKQNYSFFLNVLLLSLSSGITIPAWGQLSVNDVTTTYTIDFENTVAEVNVGAFNGSGFVQSPATGQLDADAWEITGLDEGNLSYGGMQTTGDFARGASPGNVATGGIYAFDVGGGNHALGVQATEDDWTPGTITLRIANNSGETIKGLRIDYSIFELNNAPRASNFDFSYSSDDITYTPALSYTTTEAAGFAIWLVSAQGLDIQGLDISPGGFFYLRWSGNDASGAGDRDEIALDNIQVQVTSSLSFSAGDWRPTVNNTALDTNGDWESFDGATWTAETFSPATNPLTPTRVIIDRTGITGGNSNAKTYTTLVIAAGSDLTIDVDDANIVNGTSLVKFIGAAGLLEVQNQGALFIEGDIGLDASASLHVQEGALLTLDQNSFTETHPFWEGTERFDQGSTIEVRNWDWAGSSSLLAASPQIAANPDGYIFGNLFFGATPTADFSLTAGQQGTSGIPLRLVENDLTINNGSLAQAVRINDASTASFVMLNGDLILTGGLFNCFDAAGIVTHTLTINGNVSVSGISTFQLSGSANTTAIINVLDDISFALGASFTSMNTDSEFNFTGITAQTVNISPSIDNIDFYVKNNATVQLISQNLKFNGNSSLTVENGGSFNFGFNGSTALEVEQVGGTSNAFTSQAGSTLRITSPNGISTTGDSNVKGIPTANRTFSQTATFVYIGRGTAQTTGNGLGTGFTAKTVIVQVNNGTTLSIAPNATMGISTGGSLEVRSGTFSVPLGFSVGGTGDLVMSGGELQLGALGTTLPELSGAYAITGGTITLNGAGNQVLRGGRDYSSLTFSNLGTKTLTSALTAYDGIDPMTGLDGTVEVLGDAILDLENRSFDGLGDLTMDNNALLRISRVTGTVPQLEGTYSLTGSSTIELYGSGATQSQSLRGGPAYNNIEINADAANEESGEANVITNSSFSVNGALVINAPATYQIASTFTITGNSFEVRDGAGLKYGAADGIRTFGALGNIQTISRSFSNDADYYLIGGVEQVTGDGLPIIVRKLVVDKTAENASLSQNTLVNQELRIVNEDLNLDGHNITLGGTAFLNEDRENNHIVFDTSAADGGDGLILVDGRTYDETTLNTDIAGLGLHLQKNTPGTVTIDIQRGHKRVGNINLGIRKFFEIDLVSGIPNESSIQIHYADEEYTSLTDLAGGENTFAVSRFTTSWLDGLGFVNEANNFVQFDQVTGFSTWTVTSSNFSLPFTLLGFDVEALSSHRAQLTWTTAQEIDNQGFGIEKSSNGRDFEEIAFVEASSSLESLKAYQYMDYDFYASAYYRLRQMDADGHVSYSPVVYAESPEEFQLSIYPNPVVENVTVSLQTDAPIRMLLLDMRGQVVWESNGTLSAVEAGLNRTLSAAPSGTYLVRVQTSERTYIARLVKP